MLRRAMLFFCMPCGRPVVPEEYRLVHVTDDDDALPLDVQEPNVVFVRFRTGPQEEQVVYPGTPEEVRPMTSSPEKEAGEEERVGSPEAPQAEGRVICEFNGATIISTPVEVHAAPDQGEEDRPRPSRRRRGCRRCWAERLGGKVVVLPHGRQGYRLAPRLAC